tara:strand:+ start:2290 stop:2502 length:213 start_codon:yes stop_codon:yes gene_type:complete
MTNNIDKEALVETVDYILEDIYGLIKYAEKIDTSTKKGREELRDVKEDFEIIFDKEFLNSIIQEKKKEYE